MAVHRLNAIYLMQLVKYATQLKAKGLAGEDPVFINSVPLSPLAILKAGTLQRAVPSVQFNWFSLNGNGDDGHRQYTAASALVVRALGEEAVT